MRFTTWLLAGLLLAAVAATQIAAADDNWPQFRGTSGAGACEAAILPKAGGGQGFAWRVPLAGMAWSQPIVWADRVYVVTAEAEGQAKPRPGDFSPGVPLGFSALFQGRNPFGTGGSGPPEAVYRWKLLCLELASGEIVWERVVREAQPRTGIHPNGSFASETPATDGERIVVSLGANGVYGFGVDGEPLWERDLGTLPIQFGWGTGSSPVLHGEAVYLQCDNEAESFLVALDKRTGEDVWRVERAEGSNWSTPYVWRNKLRTELVAAGGGAVRSYDPVTGELLWSTPGYGRCSVTPVGDEERLYVDTADRLSGISGVVAAIRVGAEGEISQAKAGDAESFVAWAAPIRGCRIASPALADGRLYLLAQQSGVVHCLDAASGEQVFRGRVPRATGFTASPLVAGNQVLCLDQDGGVHLLAPGEELNVVATQSHASAGEMFWASPAAAAGRLLIRGSEHLYCIGE